MPPVTKTESLFAAWSRPLSWDMTFLSETATPALTHWATSVSSPESETCRRQWLKKSLWNLKHTKGTGKKQVSRIQNIQQTVVKKSPEPEIYRSRRQQWKSLQHLKHTEDSGEKVSSIWNKQKTAVKKSPESETYRRQWWKSLRNLKHAGDSGFCFTCWTKEVHWKLSNSKTCSTTQITNCKNDLH